MDQKQKQSIIDDLDRFIKRKDCYKRIGKAWKRGYLLYGPPGTGKSSLIAAMANYLRFDIYDLDLTEVESNSDLRRLLIGMSNRSIIVAEDIDCSIEMKQREGHELKSAEGEKEEQKVCNTIWGLLNFVDGLCQQVGKEGSSSSPPITRSRSTRPCCGLDLIDLLKSKTKHGNEIKAGQKDAKQKLDEKEDGSDGDED
ncbi:Protein HYPER-SENSITIVITY-RELATED 4 [Dichanthelium oligosanthes]|uniref:Protein HYPER-SENSITIVITY-RELATED 4 n=1 Tax=Dichanthelium oligosanthes TaxID=888268 RepID=A0A1E5UMU2_9POAL|nr:Protein HYPER-SENSITIVITY-RELATED 4 [Dichanthelium oligosanthes]